MVVVVVFVALVVVVLPALAPSTPPPPAAPPPISTGRVTVVTTRMDMIGRGKVKREVRGGGRGGGEVERVCVSQGTWCVNAIKPFLVAINIDGLVHEVEFRGINEGEFRGSFMC